MICLGIESSCDETALALVRDGQLVHSVLATQVELHALFGGVVPELASREHYRFMGFLYDTLINESNVRPQDVDVYAVSRGPGLLGALLVGVGFAKGLAFASSKPVIGIDHLNAHLLAAGLERQLAFPALGLLVSGGHTHVYRMEGPDSFTVLGRTLDDAAGEAFDKVGKLLGLPYPGGRLLDSLARKGRGDSVQFPRPYTDNSNLDFSFSGLKTAVGTYLAQHPHLLGQDCATGEASQDLCDVCASFNAAVVDTLTIKVRRALDAQVDVSSLIMAGGVAANSLLRQSMQQLMEERGGELITPSPSLCTDNAAMVAYAGYVLHKAGYAHCLSFEAVPRGRAIPSDWVRH